MLESSQNKGEHIMPVVKVWGLDHLAKPQFADVLESYRCMFVQAVLNITELGLTEPEHVTVIFPYNILKTDGSVMLIEISELSDRPGRTEIVRNRLAKALGNTAQKIYPRAFIECSIAPKSRSFWSSHA